jgi:hypothetical protein
VDGRKNGRTIKPRAVTRKIKIGNQGVVSPYNQEISAFRPLSNQGSRKNSGMRPSSGGGNRY